MSTGFMNTGVTGLQAAQLGLQTTSHNIANADTAGFNRQRIVQANNTAQLTGAGFVGQGAHVTTIERMYSSFLNTQVNSAQSKVSELGAYYSQVSQIDNMLADANSGLSSALKDFFAGVQDVATNPSQVSSRQAMVSSAQSLVDRFKALDSQLNQMYDSVDGLISSTVASINSYSQQIGSLNQQIIVAQASNYQPANDLLDQRDQLVSELDKLIKVSTTTNTDGSFNVFVGTGQQLVVGAQVSTMTAAPARNDGTRIAVGLKTPSGSQELPESLINGGSLGGLIRFRSESLDSTANQLGREAASLALTFNAQNSLGQDLLGNIAGDTAFSGNLFELGTPTVIAGGMNKASSPALTVAYTPPAANGNFYTDLTASDYRLDYDGSKLTLTRLADNKTWSATDTVVAGVAVSAVDGINAKLALDPQGFSLNPATFTPADAGATYLIEPTRNAAGNISLNAAVASNPRLIAAAAPIRTVATGTNTGNAAVSAGTVATGYVAPASGAPLKLLYNSSTNSFTLVPGVAGSVTNAAGVSTAFAANVLGSVVPYTSGSTISFSGISFQISGTPNNGDTFTISRNTSASTDGRNALLLGKLQTQNTMIGQTASYQAAYSHLVGEVGNTTREIKTTGAAQEALLEQTTASRESLSGVNLDEEAANLIKYQQAYQASAKVIEMGSKLFDTLLALN